MNTSMTQEEIRRGQQAKLIWDEIVGEFFEKRRNMIIDGLMLCPIGDNHAIMSLHMHLIALQDLKNALDTYVDTGKLATVELREGIE